MDIAKTAALANWIKDQSIDTSWFLNNFEGVKVYTPKNVTIPEGYAGSIGGSDIYLYGGVSTDFTNTYVRDESLSELNRAILLSRPYYNDGVWNLTLNGKNYTAVALSLSDLAEVNYSIEFNADHYRYDLEGNAFLTSITPNATAVTLNSTMNLNLSLYGKDTPAEVKVKLVPFNSMPIESREVIAFNESKGHSAPSKVCDRAGSNCFLDTEWEGYFESVSVMFTRKVGPYGCVSVCSGACHGETEVSKDGITWKSIHTGTWSSSGTFPVGDYYRYARWQCYGCSTSCYFVNISVSKKGVFAPWEPPTVYNTSLQIPVNLTRGSYQIYTETYINGTLEDVAVSDLIYYTLVNGSDVPYNAKEYVYNATNNSTLSGDCYADGNLSDCYMRVNYVKKEGNDVEFSFNLTGAGEGMVYANGNLIGNLSFYKEYYIFVIPNLSVNKTNVISVKIFDHEGEEYYALNITLDVVPPVQSGHNPPSGSAITTMSPAVTFNLDENGDCKWSLTDQSYSAMSGDCTGDGTQSQTCMVSGLNKGLNKVHIACRDAFGNQDTAATNKELVYTVVRNYAWSDAGYEYEYCTGQVILSADDGYTQVTLSQPFPFYDANYSMIYVGSNGYITLDGGSWEYWDIENLFRNRKIVAVDAGDLVTTSYLCTYSDHITVRWVGRHYGYSDTVDVEAKLYNNGNIKINLKSIGVMNGGWPGYGVTGVSRGDNAYYTRLSTGNALTYALSAPFGEYSWIDSNYTYEDCTNQYIMYADDSYAQITLAQPFPFYDVNYSTIYVGSNGYITLDGGSWEYWDIENLFRNRKIVAVDAGDLVTTSYLCTYSDHITVRWVGRHYGYSDTVDVEAKLYNNGNIKINLKSIGVMNGGWPGYGVTGVSRGDNNRYVRATTGNTLSYILFPPPQNSIK